MSETPMDVPNDPTTPTNPTGGVAESSPQVTEGSSSMGERSPETTARESERDAVSSGTVPRYMVDEAPLSSQTRTGRSPWSSRLSLLLVAALVGGLAGHFAAPSTSTGGVTIKQVTNSPGAAILPNGMSIPALVQRVLPSVVSIDVVGNGTEDQGTGMIISKGGYVVTNNHVIAAAVNGGSITVTRSGTTKSLSATLVGTNPIDDVALLRINGASNLPVVTFGNSNVLEVGDAVVAIGNALGLAAGTPTVTQGIVSALGRTVTAGTASATETLTNMIQTDAAINPGNSGGPLLDSSGDVIGMNTAVAGTLSNGENTQNIGFAIPVATIESLLKSLMAGESVVTHGAFIGVEIESMTPSLRQEYGFSVSLGAVVISVIAGTGAAAAGIKQGDIIVGINSTPITSAQDVSSAISSLRPGDVISMHIVRGTKHLTLHVTLGHVPSS
ncbi:MAG: S1C family serine protease [Acidimicrobiales bacterium]